jgi:organic hydroperoxide reductase OsmC/OhrA
MDTHYARGRTIPATVGQDTSVAKEAKEFRYAIGLDRAGRVTADGRSPLDLDVAWTPEHLLLAGLARCTLQSLRFHAMPAGLDFLASASASGVVTKRQQDGRYAFVEIDVELDLELEPAPPGDEIRALIEKAERDCFVGASLDPPPRYGWRVNGAKA